MSLSPGASIGPFQIQSLLGKGGMGEVFSAIDTRLGRNVAIKILPPDFASDSDRLRRFQSEAKILASLNHPNLIVIHEVGADNGQPYLVSELLEGRTLREELKSGALPLRKAIDYALQITDGLAAAHTRGIIHRDLKPENIFITKGGRVKLLDFGLAKLQPNLKSELSDLQSSAPTLLQSTVPGLILGTPGYMSPEQVRGEPADHRSDIFAFGCVLFEMLIGDAPFRRNSAMETMNAVVKDEPPPAPPSFPPAIQKLARRCMDKDPEQRFQTAKDVGFAIEAAPCFLNALSHGRSVTGIPRLGMVKWILASVTLLSIGLIFSFFSVHRRTPPAAINSTGAVRYLTHSGRDSSPAASPDGKRICFASNRDGTNRLWLRDLTSGGEIPLTQGTDDYPRFSPDGATILFSRMEGTNRSLYRVPSFGGDPRKTVNDALFGDWSPDGRKIAFVRWNSAASESGEIYSSTLYLAGIDGSDESLLIELPGRYTNPRWSPDGAKIALSVFLATSAPRLPIVTVSSKEVHYLKLKGLNAVSSSIWTRDSRRLIYMQPESGGADSSSTTARIYEQEQSGEPRQIGWSPAFGRIIELLPPNRIIFDARSSRVNLKEMPLSSSPAGSPIAARLLTAGSSTDRQPIYSPDGKWIAFTSNRSGNLEVWQMNRRTGVIRRLTDHPGDDWDPSFSPGGEFLLWSSNRTGEYEIWLSNADGTNPRQVTHGGMDCENPVMTLDGKWIIFQIFDPKKSGIWRIRPNGQDLSLVCSPALGIPEISPDGKYLAFLFVFTSDQRILRVLSLSTGERESFEIRIFPGNLNASVTGRLRWMPDSQAIAFTAPDDYGVNGIYVQDFLPGTDTTATRRPLGGFDPEHQAETFAISPDGQSITIAAWEQLFSIMITDPVPSL